MNKTHKEWEKKGSLLSHLLAKGTEEAEELRGVPDLLHVCPSFSAARGLSTHLLSLHWTQALLLPPGESP